MNLFIFQLYLNNIIFDIFRIKTKEYPLSNESMLGTSSDFTGNVFPSLKLIHIFVVSSNRMLEKLYDLGIIK